MKAIVAAFNQEKALVGAFSVLTNLRMELFQALLITPPSPLLLAVVSDLLMNEARSEEKLKQKSLTKSEDSGHDSGQSSLNTACESFSESSG